MALCLALKDEESYSLLARELSADYFTNKSYRNLFMFLQQKVQELPRWDEAAFLDNIENIEIKNSMAELLFEDFQQASLSGIIKDLKLRKLKRDLEALDKAIARDPDNLELLKQKETLSREYRRMTKRVVNKVLF